MASPNETQVLTIPSAAQEETLDALVRSSEAEIRTKENFRIGERLLTEIATLTEQSAADQSVIESARLAAAKNAQAGKTAIVNKIGIDPGGTSDLILRLIEGTVNASDKTKRAFGELERARNSAFLDNPKQFIVDAMARPFLERDLKDAQAETKFFSDQLSTLNVAIKQAGEIYTGTAQTLTTATAEAATRQAAFESEINARKARLEALKFNTQEVNVSLNASKERLGFFYDSMRASQAAQSADLALKNYELNVKEFGFRENEARLRTEAKREDRDLDDNIVEKIRVGYNSRTGQDLTEGEIKTKLAIFKRGGPGSEEVAMDFRAGERSRLIFGPSLGASPADTIETISKLPVSIPPAQQPIVRILQGAREALTLNRAIDKKDKEATSAFLNSFVKNEVFLQHSRIVPDKSNMFHVGDLSTYLDNSPVLKSLPITKKLFEPAIQAGQPLSDPRQVLALTQKAILSNTITLNEAAEGIVTYYRQANLANISALDPDKFGIVLPSYGRSYNAIDANGDVINLADPLKVSTYFSKNLAREVFGARFREFVRERGAAAGERLP